MSELQIAVLALVQGITEFLPISSSAHLILVPLLTGWPDQGLLIDIAVHVGSLGAVLLYFRGDLQAMLGGALRAPGGRADPGRRLILLIGLATLPILAAGLALGSAGTENLRSLVVIGWSSLLFGIVLYLADRFAPRQLVVEEMTVRGALLIGFAQTLALIPGTSRAGITMTAARLLGFRRDEAARFSMLLAIPTILAAGGLLALDVVRLGARGTGPAALLAAVLAFGAALAAIVLMMRWLQHASFTPFVVYRCVLGILLLAWAYSA
jgi:undecaprenyl-diphosphatase